jgi:hypothetical protein
MPQMNHLKKVEIDPETADRITLCTLRESIKYLKEDITTLKKKKKLQAHEKIDVADAIKDLAVLEGAYDYYGGNIY